MAKFVCTVCGYVYEGEAAPAECPICHAPAEKFVKQEGEMTWASEHVVGVAKGVSEDILADLRANFEGECSEVGMYLAMARVAHREGYPEIGMYYEKAAYEEAEVDTLLVSQSFFCDQGLDVSNKLLHFLIGQTLNGSFQFSGDNKFI